MAKTSRTGVRARNGMKKEPAAGPAGRKPHPAVGDASAGHRLIPPRDGVTVRMYRIGHGDCFLLAFPPAAGNRPVYVLIDCGYKPGSPKHINTKPAEVVASIREATGGHIDVAVITHEHQDHVNAITAANFEGFTVGETWVAWTEDPEDQVAEALRGRYRDRLLGLLAARNRLAADGDAEKVRRIDEFLDFELGGEGEDDPIPRAVAALAASGGDPANSVNKRAMKLLKDRARDGVRCLRPHEAIIPLPGAQAARVFVLGPPRDPDDPAARLEDLDPQGAEAFHRAAMAVASANDHFAAAARGAIDGKWEAPFASRFRITLDAVHTDPEHGAFFASRYGRDDILPGFAPGLSARGPEEVPDNPGWRRIDREWLYSADQLALDMNDYTNNASLVLAFELKKGGKVLLFAADAQRGNWVSWATKHWKDGPDRVTARDLLARTVLYKVGHHGSHNATLDGPAEARTPNLAWMAGPEHAREFSAMITAVRSWAETQKGWDHPLKSIKDALLRKCSGRVFQTDTDLDKMEKPLQVSDVEWKRFTDRVRGNGLYFDYTITG